MALGNKARLCDQVRIDHVYDADGAYDGTGQTMLDMRDFDGCCVLLVGGTTASATHHITGFTIISNSASDGSGTDTVFATAVDTEGGTTTAAAAMTQADYGIAANTTINSQMMVLDVRADKMADSDRYIAAVTTSTGTFITHIIYVRYNGNFSFKDMFQATRTAFQLDAAAV